jgi:carbon monoxide dehydrogenase subunit G
MAMTMTGEVTLPAGRPRVWAMLNDAAVLKVSIPGCQSLEKTSDTTFAAVVRVKIGPVGASFKGKVQLSDIDSPNGYTISGEGEGGVAGFANGGAKVQLVEASAGTVLRYDVQANVGGKIAQLGSRLIDGVAKKMADQFFANFATAVKGPNSAADAPIVEGPGASGSDAVAAAPNLSAVATTVEGASTGGGEVVAGGTGSSGAAIPPAAPDSPIDRST